MSDRSQNFELRPESLLPLVRAAMSRGEGPPAVLAWMRAQGQGRVAMAWSSGDEARARELAARLARTLTHNRGRHGARTVAFGDTRVGFDSRA